VREPRPEWGEPRHDRTEPEFEDYDERDLPAGVRAELKGITPELAHVIGGHLRMVGLLLEDDPSAAMLHAKAAKARAGRLMVVREAVAEAAYAVEDYRVALAEYQVLRRMTGDDNYLPVMADCQRALGKPAAAIELLAQADTRRMSSEQRIEAVLVASGARLELGQIDEARRVLQKAIKDRLGGPSGQARLRFALASAMEKAGDVTGAREWYESCLEIDPAGGLDARNRLRALDGLPPLADDEDDGSGEFVVAELADEETERLDEAESPDESESGEDSDE